MTDARLPAHVEALGLIRQVQTAGGFGAVIRKGERDSGTIIVVLTENGTKSRIYERMPDIEGRRNWWLSKEEDPDKKEEFNQYLSRRAEQDPDCWIIELDIAQGERFIGLPTRQG